MHTYFCTHCNDITKSPLISLTDCWCGGHLVLLPDLAPALTTR